jgi:DNA topoisomerase-1
MTPAKYETTIVRVINNGNKFYTYSRVLKFLGYKKVYSDKDEIHQVPIFSKDSIGSKIKIQSILIKEHSTLPPPRFSQATLIKELDGLGIGRPSTYKSMVNMPLQRGYAELTDKNYHILPLGIEVVNFLKMYFSFLLDTNFTNEVETDLDNIADGKLS